MLKAVLFNKISSLTFTMETRIGLSNIGNTCFLNVVLQALRLSPAIGHIFLKNMTRDLVRKDSKKKELVQAFQTLIQDFWKQAPPEGVMQSLAPHGFFHALRNTLRDTEDDWYRPGTQADAAEALQYILDSIHEGLSRGVAMDVIGDAKTPEEASHIKSVQSWIQFFSKEYSPIVFNFNGQMQIRVTCSKCNTSSERYEPWLMLKAPIPGAETESVVPSMNTCMNLAFADETLDDYNCEVCKSKQKAVIQNKISRLPPVTILTLKRFTNGGHKIRGRIGWDLDKIDFSKWMAFSRDPFTNDAAVTSYSTYAVIEHHGSSKGGHYRMYARQGDVWNEYDDSSMRRVTPDQVITADSYIAFLAPSNTYSDMVKYYDKLILKFREFSAGTLLH
jgi:ubiquitin C-terminal hydrolase